MLIYRFCICNNFAKKLNNMKKIILITSLYLISFQILNAQSLKPDYTCFEISSFTTSAGRGLNYVSGLTVINNKHSLSVGVVFQNKNLYGFRPGLLHTGFSLGYKYALTYTLKRAQLFTEIFVSTHKSTNHYDYTKVLDRYDISYNNKQYNVLEYYAGFGFQTSLNRLFFWNISLGIGGLHSTSFMEYNQYGEQYATSINDIGLMMKTSLGIRFKSKQ